LFYKTRRNETIISWLFPYRSQAQCIWYILCLYNPGHADIGKYITKQLRKWFVWNSVHECLPYETKCTNSQFMSSLQVKFPLFTFWHCWNCLFSTCKQQTKWIDVCVCFIEHDRQ